MWIMITILILAFIGYLIGEDKVYCNNCKYCRNKQCIHPTNIITVDNAFMFEEYSDKKCENLNAFNNCGNYIKKEEEYYSPN